MTLAGFASVMPTHSHVIRLPVPLPALDSPQWQNPLRAFAWGMWSVTSTVLALVLFATYLGIGALAHDTHFSLGWVLASTALRLGRAGADHPDFDAGFRRHGGAGGHCRDRQRDPAVSDGGVGVADDAHADNEAASSGAGDPFHRGHAVGRMLSPAATGAARAAYRLHARAGHRSGLASAWLRPRSATVSPPISRNCSPRRSCC